MTEYLTAIGSYTLNYDDVSLDNQFYTINEDGSKECNTLLAGRYLCDALGKDLSSIIGLSLVYDTRDSRYRPTRGHNVTLGVNVAGLGGDVKYARLTGQASKYWNVGGGFIFSLSAEGGYIKALQNRGGEGVDDIRITDRFFLGEPQIRGFDIRGVGPRVLRKPLTDLNNCASDDATCTPNIGPNPSRSSWTDDALGGRAYYIGRAELEIPLGSGAREMGLRPSIFVDAGAVWGVTKPKLTDTSGQYATGIFIPAYDPDGNKLYTEITSAVVENGVCVTKETKLVTNETNLTPPTCLTSAANTPYGTTISAFKEYFVGNTPKPRVSVGIGVNWNSPFGPLRIDFAKVLLKEQGDDTKAFSFNVGTQF